MVPRQNGKNVAVEIRELHGTVTRGERFLHTAHEVKTARKAFARLLEFFDNPREQPELTALVKEVRRTNGQEAIVLDNGGSVEFVARSKSSGRGFSVDTLVCDEAQELDDEALAALLFTISASDNPQTIFTGTPPGPKASGETFRRLRKAAHERKDRRLAWHEWGCEGKNLDVNDPANWAQANPGYPYRISAQTISDELTIVDETTFARERLGVWDDELSGATVVDLDLWQALTDRLSQIEGAPVFAVDAAPDRSSAAIAVAGRRADGLEHVEIVESAERFRPGVVTDKLVELCNKWHAGVILDASGPAGALIAGLDAAGVDVRAISAREMTQACGAFVDAVNERRVRHLGQPWLNQAVAGARKRALGDAFAWARRDINVDIAPLVAATLARYAVISKPDAKKRKRTGKVW